MGTRLAHTPRSRCHPQMGRRHRLARPPPHKPPPKHLGLTLHQLFLSFNPAVGPGCSVCPWAAARPRAVRAASFARRVASKPGQALPPPTGTAAWPSGPSGALHTGGTWCTDGVRSPARPCHRPRAPQPGPPYPGVLHAGGACGAVRAGTRLEARPCPPDPPVPSTPVVPGR